MFLTDSEIALIISALKPMPYGEVASLVAKLERATDKPAPYETVVLNFAETSEEAPYGYRKDGKPRLKPGRPLKKRRGKK